MKIGEPLYFNANGIPTRLIEESIENAISRSVSRKLYSVWRRLRIACESIHVAIDKLDLL
jgi:hypothetical protein